MHGFLNNVRLNPGGILGAFVAVLATTTIALLVMQNNARVPRGSYKILILAAIAGGLFGNWLWRLAFGSDSWEPPPTFGFPDDDRKP